MKFNLEQFIFKILQSSQRSFMVYFITFVLFALSVATFPTQLVKAKMLPSKDSDSFSIYVDLKEGSSKEQTKAVTQCIAKQLQQEPLITNISVFIGEAQPLDFAGMVKGSALKNSSNLAEMMVNIKRANLRDESSYNLVSRIRPIIIEACQDDQTIIKFIELPAGPPVLASIVAEVYGAESFEARRAFAYKIKALLQQQKALVDVDVLADESYDQFSLKLDSNKAIHSQISLAQLKQTLFLAFEGQEIAAVNEEKAENQIPIFLRLDNSRKFERSTKASIEAKLATLKLMNKQGLHIPLSEFVTVIESKSHATLTSKNLNAMINVVAETNKESQIYPLLDARTAMLEAFDNNYEVKKSSLLNLTFKDKRTGEVFELVWDGELKVTIDTFIDLGGAFIIALVLIFFLMVIYYKSFALSGAIVLASFISIIGVIWAHYLFDLFTADTFYLTATSLIGFIGLIGINSRNSTLIIDFSKQLVREENKTINEAIAKATATRSKPIILTVLTMVFASSLLATDAVFGGLGVALIGGTLASYVVSMFFVPVSIKNSLHKIL